MRCVTTTSRRVAMATMLVGAAWVVSAFAALPAMAGNSLVIRDFVLTHGIYEREPVGTTDSFSIDDARGYAFVRIANDGAPTTVSFVWMHGGETHADIDMNIGTSSGWRTWSSINLKPGQWRVDVKSSEGTILAQRSFMVEGAMSQPQTSSNGSSRSQPAARTDSNPYGSGTVDYDG